MADDRSGHSVSLSSDGSTVAIGAKYNDGNGFNSGHVRIYRLNGDGQWVKIGDDIDGEARLIFQVIQLVFPVMDRQLLLSSKLMEMVVIVVM